MTPFTYIITHIPTKVNYYGVRYSKDCHPSDLGSTYFSSSKVLQQLIEHEGVESFRFQVRRTFSTKEAAVQWEAKVLRRLNAASSDRWLNQHNGDGKLINKGGYQLTEITKRKMRKPKSPKHKVKLQQHLDRVRQPCPKGTKKPELSERMRGNQFAKGNPGPVFTPERRKAHSDRLKGNQLGKLNKGKKKNLTEKTCPHCGSVGRGGGWSRWHFNNCAVIR